MLKEAKNIPAQEIMDRLAEISKDKEIIVHYAIIKIDRDGRYEITKE